MASYRRGGGDYDDRESYYGDRGGPRRSTREVDEVDVRVRERDRDRDRESRVPNFMRDDNRRPEAGALVLRSREVETVDRARPRPRSPSPVRFVRRARSVSPPPREEVRTRVYERETDRVRSPSRGPDMERMRARIIERSSPSPPPAERVRTRMVQRERSPSPDYERERIRIIERERQRAPSPSPSPPPPPPDPPVIRGPTIEREVITHYTDVDHGVIVARPPSPPPPPRPRKTDRETDIDIYTSRNETEVDITKTTSHSHSRQRSRSRSRHRPFTYERGAYHDDEVLVQSERDRLRVDIEESRGPAGHRRAHSAAPPRRPAYDDEAEYITSKIDARGRAGEAWNGATRDWTIVDVPPGTERVRMDGAGGGAAEVTWQRYNGVRRARFVPDRDADRDRDRPAVDSPRSSSTTIISDSVRDRGDRGDRGDRDRLSVQIYDKDRDVEVEKVTDRRISLRPALPPPPAPKRSDMWTEITKDLVVREAIEELGFEYEETEYFYYVMQYLRYEDVLQLVERSDTIRRARKDRLREIQWERELRDDWERERERERRRRYRPRPPRDKVYEDERVVLDREVVYDRSRYR